MATEAQKQQEARTFLVGGAVRDELLGLEVVERDWVVVGSTPSEMKAQGYQQVGKDFPVFLHPQSHEEYALARKERKIAPGHTGFEFDTDRTITLEEDLGRRDLTINAIARTMDGQLVDPYKGAEDIESRCLRHVSGAFSEDPLRVIRLARFAARFTDLGFQIAPETRALCIRMVARGALTELPPERIFQELDKALATNRPDVFFEFLSDISASSILWPELDEYPFELLTRSTLLGSNAQRYALLFIQTPPDRITIRSRALRTPRSYQDLALQTSNHKNNYNSLPSLQPNQIVEFLYAVDAFRRPDRFKEFCEVCQLAYEFEGGYQDLCHAWQDHFNVARLVTRADIDSSLSGANIGKAIRSKQIESIGSIIHSHSDSSSSSSNGSRNEN